MQSSIQSTLPVVNHHLPVVSSDTLVPPNLVIGKTLSLSLSLCLSLSLSLIRETEGTSHCSKQTWEQTILATYNTDFDKNNHERLREK